MVVNLFKRPLTLEQLTSMEVLNDVSLLYLLNHSWLSIIVNAVNLLRSNFEHWSEGLQICHRHSSWRIGEIITIGVCLEQWYLG
jgi:hypothetical protein